MAQRRTKFGRAIHEELSILVKQPAEADAKGLSSTAGINGAKENTDFERYGLTLGHVREERSVKCN
jgi:hypothetical protein